MFGNELYLAIHTKAALPDILKLPPLIVTKLKALQVASEALEQMRLVQESEEAEQRAIGLKRHAEQTEAEQRRSKMAVQDLAQSEQWCNSFLLGGKCTKANGSYKHVKGTPGVD